MRWFIVFLLVANVILFFWLKQQSMPTPGLTELPAPDIGRLRLLTEESGETEEAGEPHRDVVDSQAPAPATAAVPGLSAPGREVPAGEEDVDLPPARMDGPLASLGAEQTEAPGMAAGEVPVAEDLPAVAASPGPSATGSDAPAAAEAASTVLTAELPAPIVETPIREDSETTMPAPEPDPVAEVAEEAQPVCARVGPFSGAEADRLLANLPGHLKLLSVSSEEYSIADSFFVMIPPLPSRSAGNQMLKELADAGITDTWLFPSGEYRNAISLGLFRRESGARRHAANLQKQGFGAEVKERTSRKEGRWLLLQNIDGVDIASSLPISDPVKVEPRPCP